MSMKILILDNYDSFTYNLVHAVEYISGNKIDVFRNDKISLEEVGKYDKIILSPGPGLPKDAGIMPALIKEYAATKTILGVCLGHQAITECFGGTLYNMPKVYHGVASDIKVLKQDNIIFKDLAASLSVGRYHSWISEKKTFPADLEITAEDENGFIMALAHKTFDIQGVQFHPESVLTPDGNKMLENWLKA